MFEKEAEEWADKNKTRGGSSSFGDITNYHDLRQGFIAGAEYGYNKANEWHYVKDELPRKSDSTLCELMPVFVAVKVGYHIETYGTYWNLKIGKFECLDEIYAWCYTPEPPELPKEIE